MRTALALLLTVAATSTALADPCDVAPVARRVHKVLVTFPEPISTSEAAREKAVVALRHDVREVIADYGVGIAIPVVVTADDRQIAALTKRGLGAQVSDELDLVSFQGVVIDTSGRGRLEKPLRISGWELEAKRVVPYAVQLRGPSYTGAWFDGVIAKLDAMGLQYGQMFDGSLDVAMTEAQARKVSALAEVQWVGRVEPLYKVSPELAGLECPLVPLARVGRLAAAAGDRRTAGALIDLTVTYFEDSPALRAAIKAAGGTVMFDGSSSGGAFLTISAPRRAIRTLAIRSDVAAIAGSSPGSID
ncbi:MAG: hypothetical protein H6Q90_4722 [Deltaproteobacteria bacterium]|nr:hypothetical protein [Deltaproteobacteria bacterium]